MSKILFLFAFLCSSCAWIGSSSRLINKPTNKIDRVAVLILQDLNYELKPNEVESFIFTKALAEELALKRLFRFKILDKQYDFESFDTTLKRQLSEELASSYDALLVFHPVSKGMNYKVELVMIQTGNGMELLRAKHGTGGGNSYWWPESSQETLVDATKGVVEVFDRKWRRTARRTFPILID